jgi:hypothetical protein
LKKWRECLANPAFVDNVDCSEANSRKVCLQIVGVNGGAGACKFKKKSQLCVNNRQFVDNDSDSEAETVCTVANGRKRACVKIEGPNGGDGACVFVQNGKQCLPNPKFIDNELVLMSKTSTSARTTSTTTINTADTTTTVKVSAPPTPSFTTVSASNKCPAVTPSYIPVGGSQQYPHPCEIAVIGALGDSMTTAANAKAAFSEVLTVPEWFVAISSSSFLLLPTISTVTVLILLTFSVLFCFKSRLAKSYHCTCVDNLR